jgi:hypothetical protein
MDVLAENGRSIDADRPRRRLGKLSRQRITGQHKFVQPPVAWLSPFLTGPRRVHDLSRVDPITMSGHFIGISARAANHLTCPTAATPVSHMRSRRPFFKLRLP